MKCTLTAAAGLPRRLLLVAIPSYEILEMNVGDREVICTQRKTHYTFFFSDNITSYRVLYYLQLQKEQLKVKFDPFFSFLGVQATLGTSNSLIWRRREDTSFLKIALSIVSLTIPLELVAEHF